MRTLETPAIAALDGAAVVVALLVEMELSETIRLCSAGRDIVFDGDTYQAIGDLGRIEEVTDEPGEVSAMRFTLSGVRNENLAISLSEPIRNRPVLVRMAILDADTHAVLDAPIVWSGSLDQMPIEYGSESSVITVTAQHRGVTYARPKPLRYTDADQQRLYPDDTSLRFVASQAAHEDIWPAASYFRI